MGRELDNGVWVWCKKLAWGDLKCSTCRNSKFFCPLNVTVMVCYPCDMYYKDTNFLPKFLFLSKCLLASSFILKSHWFLNKSTQHTLLERIIMHCYIVYTFIPHQLFNKLQLASDFNHYMFLTSYIWHDGHKGLAARTIASSLAYFVN